MKIDKFYRHGFFLVFSKSLQQIFEEILGVLKVLGHANISFVGRYYRRISMNLGLLHILYRESTIAKVSKGFVSIN